MARKKQAKSISVKTSLDDMTISELKKLAKSEGIDLKGVTKKTEIINKIHEMQSEAVEAEEITIEEKPAKKTKKAAKKPKAPPKKTKKAAKKPKAPPKKAAKKPKAPPKAAAKKPNAPPKKAAKKPKAPPKKAAKKPKMATKKDLSEMLVSTLRAECKKREIDCSKAKSKAALIALLEGEEVVKVSKKAKVPAKKPAKKAKKPAKKAKKSAKKPAKKAKGSAKRCDSEEDWVECEDGTICNSVTGRCIKDTTVNRKKYSESISLKDGRKIIGSKESIEALKKILKDQIVDEEETIEEEEEEEEEKRCDAEEDWLECDEDEVCDAEEGKCVKEYSGKKYELQVEGRKIIGNKETIEKLQKVLGGEIEVLEEEVVLKKLMEEEEEEEAKEIEKEIEKKTKKMPPRPLPRRPKKEEEVKIIEKKSTPKPKESVKVELKKQEIYDTFMKCIESLQA